MRSLRRHYPDQVRRVCSQARPALRGGTTPGLGLWGEASRWVQVEVGADQPGPGLVAGAATVTVVESLSLPTALATVRETVFAPVSLQLGA